MNQSQNSGLVSFLHSLFRFGIFIKGVNGVWETISGILILSFNKAAFSSLFYLLVRKELLEDPNDRLTTLLAYQLENLSHSTQIFAAVYILLHGLLNLFLMVELYRNKLWAYGVSIGVMSVLIFYQVYRISLYHSLLLAIVTIWDIIFIFLIWHEYKYQKSRVFSLKT